MTRDGMLYRVMRALAKLYTRVFLDMDVVWEGNVPQGPRIFVANHPSTTDPFYLAMLVNSPSHVLVFSSAFELKFWGKLLLKLGHIPVYKDNGHAAYDAAIQALKRGETVILFPEGRISPVEGGFYPSKSGAARMALETGAPVIPAGIAFPWGNVRSSQADIAGTSCEARLLLKGAYNMTVGQPLYLKGNVDDRADVVRARDEIMTHIGRLSEQSRWRLGMRHMQWDALPGAEFLLRFVTRLASR